MKNEITTLTINLPSSIIIKLKDIAERRSLTVDDYIRISLRAMARKSKFFDLDDQLTFGKYEGEILITIIKTDPTYIIWCIRNIEGFLISDGAEELLIEILHEEGIEIGTSLYETKSMENVKCPF